MNINDPNCQQRHTFGDSPAAERLKEEIDKGARYRAAVRLLNLGRTRANELMFSNLPSQKYFLQMLKRDIVDKINQSSSDEIIRSLCRNVFTTSMRQLFKLSMFK